MNQLNNIIIDNSDINGRFIAIVEDEPDIAELVALNLKRAGFNYKVFHKAESFLTYIKDHNPMMVLLDLMLPDADGFEICKYLKKDEKYSDIPIIMLTAKGEETDKVLGLELGADDYITKPFSVRELIARVKAVLRRDNKGTKDKLLRIGNILEINLNKYEVYVENERIELTATEFKILTILMERKGWVFTRGQILDRIDPLEKGVLDRTVDVHIKNLRDKLKSAGRFIKNIRGIGYKLDEDM
jgi:DNA-binding response OmpR family regulator